MSETRAPTTAAALPHGSVVAIVNVIYIKNGFPGDWYPWQGSNGGVFSDDQIARYLHDGGQVLRVGERADEP